jgi:hypothetical protein
MRMKFWAGISKTLTSGWMDDILTGENDKLSPYKMLSNTQNSTENQKIAASS